MRIGVYLADQAWGRTQSKGIYVYSRLFVAQLLDRLGDHELVLIVNSRNRQDMVPEGSTCARVVELPALSAGGLTRLAADHLAAPLVARSLDLDLLHFPKGFVPLVPCGRTRMTATIHDTIPIFYQRHLPGHFSPAHLRYFRWMLCHSLRRAAGIMTDSAFSRKALLDLAREARITPAPIEVCAPSPEPALVADSAGPRSLRSEQGLLHLGSPLPHKRTAETIRLFRTFNRNHGGGWRLRVTGILHAPVEWRIEPGPDVVFIGTLAGPALRVELERARALLLLSSVEGFGLPALEAWFLGTPVCYSSGGALAEVLQGIPGHAGDASQDAFDAALERVLALSERELAVYSARLRDRFSVERFGQRVAAIVGRWLDEGATVSRPSGRTTREGGGR